MTDLIKNASKQILSQSVTSDMEWSAPFISVWQNDLDFR